MVVDYIYFAFTTPGKTGLEPVKKRICLNKGIFLNTLW